MGFRTGEPSRLSWTSVHVPSDRKVQVNRPEFSFSSPGSVSPADRRSSFVMVVTHAPTRGKPVGAALAGDEPVRGEHAARTTSTSVPPIQKPRNALRVPGYAMPSSSQRKLYRGYA